MIKLTESQQQAVDGRGEAVRVRDRKSLREYVILRADVYDRLRQLLEAEVVDPSLYEFEEAEPTEGP